MIGVDTNVVVRMLTGDDPVQSEKARDLFSREAKIFLADTVVLETEWVLRHAYRFQPTEIHEGFSRLFELPNLVLSSKDRMEKVLDRYAAGMDFADALHLVSCDECEGFFTFDRQFAKKGQDDGAILV
ncbi:MAG: type II toxin-antitoxin system VapC family toxin [Desulfococcaceae bacterium]